MKQRILTELRKIEAEKNVSILYACESGSRAWGFPSADSDYDVRFLYLHPRDWYLSINLEKKRDVIEYGIRDNIDLSGWDLRKALGLFYKSNPPLLEWLGSPIVYLEQHSVATRMRQLSQTNYSPKACMYHYFHMAQGNYREYLRGDKVWVKKYFYVLRPILAINWIEKGLGVVPTEFRALVDKVITDSDLKLAINNLVKDKEQGHELDRGPAIPVIKKFIDSEMRRLEDKRFSDTGNKPHLLLEGLNELFRSALKEME